MVCELHMLSWSQGEVGWSPAENRLLGEHREALFTNSLLPANKASLFNKHLTNKMDLKLEGLFNE